MRFLGLALSLVGVLAFMAPVAAQNCTPGTVVLSVTPANPAPGAPITIAVTGTPGAFVTMYRSNALGSTTLQGGPLNGTTICLAAPLYGWTLGAIPASGTRTVQYPTFAGAAGLSYSYQALTVAPGATPQHPTIDTSNTATISFSTPPPPTCTPGAVQLAITPNNPTPGSPLSVTVTGTVGANALLFFGQTTGATQLPNPGPLHNAVICLNAPFQSFALGPIPASGSRTVNIPTPPNAAVGSTINYQAVTVAPGATPQTATVDTSNTVAVTFAAPPPPPPCTPGTVQLVITPDAPVQAGNTITISVTGTAGAHLILAESRHLGSSTLPQNSGTLCLAMPYHASFLGVIPASGTYTQSHVVPPNANLPGNLTVYYQAVTVTGSGQTHTYDTSNTDSLTF